ncbi:MAG: hypothetical protein D6685_08525 [Bacteroidetes bacterium]|nr:hypothetical protein AWN76_011280 [Rhodothermaceae bacterium RA]RMH62662.1 MAG: hypothetical protein D6685_08525 [Bacteroidota bacterium]
MNEQVDRLIEDLKARLIEVSEEEIVQIIQESRAEALAEAKAILKERVLHGILEHAVHRPTAA